MEWHLRIAKGVEDCRAPYRLRHWAVVAYIKRKLTFSGDRLPAISGLAREIGLATEDDHIVGLWRGDVLRSLLRSFNYKETTTVVAPASYLAPS